MRAGYGRTDVLGGVSLQVAPGRLTALVGPNGSGKSSLLRAVMGFLPVRAGTVRLDGRPLAGMARREMARRIAYLPQENACPDYMTLGELVELGGHARRGLMSGPSGRDRAVFAAALGQVGLGGMGHLQVNALSGGQRQRGWIALVLAQDAPWLLLDEPVNHLDVKYQYEILRLARSLAASGRSVVAVLHDLSLAAAFADDLVMMRDGKVLAAGPLREVLTAGAVRAAFGIEAEVFERGDRLVCLPDPAAAA
nr:ABC transporter ATP-binding protein [Mangrovicoccus sp. HB161399]